MNQSIEKVDSAINLPEAWDLKAAEYFQTRRFLLHTERFNPCTQRYYFHYRNGSFNSGLVVYTLNLDLLTYLSIPSPFRMHIAGIPCSVSSSGFIGDFKYFPYLVRAVKNEQKGLLLCLNLDTVPQIPGFSAGRTLPTILIENHFESWDQYIQSLRSDYRRRLMAFSHAFTDIRAERGDCSLFNHKMYCQYRDVLKRSKGKLETLFCPFFQNLPPDFRLTAYYREAALLGWAISVKYKTKYYFFLGGINYQLNRDYHTYFNILTCVLREGIETNASIIDLGQTAEIPKMRLGER